MVKKIVLLFISSLMILSLSSCGQKKEVTDTPEQIEQKIADALGSDKYLCNTTVAKDEFFKFYELDESQVESYVAKESSNPSEIPDRAVVIKVKEDYSKTAVDQLNKAYAKIVESVRKTSSDLGKTLNARIYEQDGYIAFFLAGTKFENGSSEKEIRVAKKDYETVDNTWKELFGSMPSNLAIVPPAK